MAENKSKRKKISLDEGGGGGHEAAGMMRWLLTYADMITLLLALFVMLFAISQVDKAKLAKISEAFQGAIGDEKETKSSGDRIPKSDFPKGKTTIKPPIRPYLVMPDLKKISKELQEIIEAKGLKGNVKITLDERGLKISLLTGGAFFDLGKADLKPKLRSLLTTIVYKINIMKNPVRIEGHTDNLPISTPEFPSNWELSTRRATNVLRFLIVKGIPQWRLSAAGYADTRPQYPNIPGKGNPKNRRVDIIILMGEEAKLEPKAKIY